MSDHVKNQMRPIARNLKAPPLPRFTDTLPEPKIAATFKTNVLAFQSVKKVRISHYESGPLMFYVQTESSDGEFQKLVDRLQKTELRSLKSRPASIGMACLARHDRKIFRAAIAKIPQHPTQDYSVNFVDYGFNRSVRLDNLFYIPDDFLSQLTFAMPFCLAGCRVNELKLDKEVNFYFRQLTENRSLILKCVPSDGPPICQYCELVGADKASIQEKLRSWDPYDSTIKFRPQSKLESKAVLDVKVSYVNSAKEFYVHLQQQGAQQDYDQTCDELYKSIAHSPVHRNPKPGGCCAVDLGGEWYRGLITGGLKNGRVQVQIVDFGIVEEVSEKHVHLLPEKFVEKPPFAFRCSLRGFESLEVSENISTQFDIFCGDGRGERKIFKLTIVEVIKDSYLVELEDLSVNPPVNVNKMLLKNSRPLIETIQLENARKRQKEARNFQKSSSEGVEQPAARINDRDRNSAQRGRGGQISKGQQRNISVPFDNSNSDANKHQQSPRTFFGKPTRHDDGLLSPASEAGGWRSKESTPNDHHSSKSPEYDQPRPATNHHDKVQKAKNAKSSKQVKKPSDLKTGWVSTLLTVNRAFVHFDEHIEGLERILDEMFAFYENKTSRPHLKELQVGADCATRSNDGNWYRSRIESISGDKIKVFHREYGNSETIHKSKIRALDEKFASMSELAVSTFFAIKPAPESDEKTLFNEMTKVFEDGAKEFNFKVAQKLNGGLVLEPIGPDGGKNVIDELVKAKKAQRIAESELLQILERKVPEVVPNHPKKEERKSPEKPKRASVEKSAPVKQQVEVAVKVEEPSEDVTRIPIKITAITSPTDFYVSQVDEIPNFAQLHADIQIIASGVASLTKFDEGTLCLAQQPFDSCWYRAKIIVGDDDEAEQNVMITVRCLDDGKTFSVDDKSFLKLMPAAVEKKKFFGVACSLPIKLERKCEENATDLMMNLMDNELQVSFITDGRANDRISFVELFNSGENVSDLLVQKNQARRLEKIQPGKCFTSHINSLSSFYLQFEMDQLKLDLISQYFEEACGEFEKVDATPGAIVAALFPDDGCWYRSKVESIDDDGFTVKFIDYGNLCHVDRIGKIIEPAIVELPAMSKHCSLAKPKGVKRFSEEAERKFVEICANGASILDVKMIKPGEAVEIEIFFNGRNVAMELRALCDAANDFLGSTIDSYESGNLMSPN